MTDEDIDRRLRTVERALTDADTEVPDLSGAAAVHERLDAFEATVDDLTERLDALDATVQSLHGYVGELEAVNDRVERRADAARAAVERLEDQHRQSTAGDSLASDRSATDSSTSSNRSDALGPVDGDHPDSCSENKSTSNPFDGSSGQAGDEAAESLLDRVRESL